MSDSYEETARIVQEGELKLGVDELRSVRLEDGRNTVTEIHMRDRFGEWGGLSTGLARRRKGDRRDPELGGALSLYRALVHLAERHREQFAQKWPTFFPKTPAEVTGAHTDVREAGRQVARAQERLEAAKCDLDRIPELEARISEALELLEASPEAWLGSSNDLTAAAHVLRGGDAKEKNPSNERGGKALEILQVGPREVMPGVVEAWSSVAGRALAVLRGDADDES